MDNKKKESHALLDECKKNFKKIDAIEEKLNNTHDDLIKILVDLRKDYRQIIYAMIALIAGMLGIKIVGSPPWDDIRAFVAAFGGSFVLSFLIFEWRAFRWWKRVVLFLFGSMVIVSTFTRLLVYKSGTEAAPTWFPFLMDVFMILISISLVLSVWKYKWK